MLQKIENFIFNEPAIKGIHFLEQPEYTSATALQKDLLAQLQQEFQRVPPITSHHTNEKLLASVWAFIAMKRISNRIAG